MNDNILHLMLHFLMSLLLCLFFIFFNASPWDHHHRDYHFTVPAIWKPIVNPGRWNAAELLCGCVAATALAVGLSLTGEAPTPHKLLFILLVGFLAIFSPPFISALINCNRLGTGDLDNGWVFDLKIMKVLHFACKTAFSCYLLGTQKFVDASLLLKLVKSIFDQGSQADIFSFFAPTIYMIFISFRLWQVLGETLVDLKGVLLKDVLFRVYQNFVVFQSGVPAVFLLNFLVCACAYGGHLLGYKVRKAIIRHGVRTSDPGNPTPLASPEEKARTEVWASWVGRAGVLYFVGLFGVLMMSAE